MPRKRSLSYLRLLTADRHFLDQPLGWGDTQDILYSYNVEKLQSYNVITLLTAIAKTETKSPAARQREIFSVRRFCIGKAFRLALFCVMRVKPQDGIL